MTRESSRDLTRAQLDRLHEIDFRLFFLGELRRADLTETFDITPVSASRDIALYLQLHPGSMALDASRKVYEPAPDFSPRYAHDVGRALRALSKGSSESSQSSRRPLIPSDTPTPISLPNNNILATVTRAIHGHYPLRIAYHSFSSGAQDREVVPFVLVDNGHRWHVRAFDRRRDQFLDFVLTRIESASGLPHDRVREREKPEHDFEWARVIELRMVAHPKRKHPHIVAMDYAMTDGVLRVRVRAALASYMLRQWLVDCTPDASLEGEEYRLWLQNSPVLYEVSNAQLAPGYRDAGPPTL